MTTPANYIVEADWDNDKKYNNAHSDLSVLWKEMNIVRGRDSELENDMQVGTLEMRLLNQDKLFSPAYAAGDLFGKLLPRRRITVKTG
ncbi:MAG: hypothetical protein Q8O55_11400, partial [Dehalococcoidales bacterium]|nr:hypothetical protein [Dehalococcoidales bacterium]